MKEHLAGREFFQKHFSTEVNADGVSLKFNHSLCKFRTSQRTTRGRFN